MTVSDPLVTEGQESPREDTKRIALVGGLEVWSRVESWTGDEQNGRLGGGQEGIWSPEDRLLSRLSGRSDPGAHWSFCRVPCIDRANPSAPSYK